MKVNQSLREFRNHILFLLISGLVLVFGGTALALAQLSSYNPNASALLIGEAAGQIGFVLIALGIFGSFLRRTARAIIDGLGGSVMETASFHSDTESFVEASPNTSSERRDSAHVIRTRANLGPSDSWQSLTGREYKSWQAAGQPDLKPWDEAGQPDFVTWLKSRETEK